MTDSVKACNTCGKELKRAPYYYDIIYELDLCLKCARKRGYEY